VPPGERHIAPLQRDDVLSAAGNKIEMGS